MKTRRPESEHLRRLVADGLTPAQIAVRLGASTSSVRSWIHAEGLTIARPRVKSLGAWGPGAYVALPKLGGRP